MAWREWLNPKWHSPLRGAGSEQASDGLASDTPEPTGEGAQPDAEFPEFTGKPSAAENSTLHVEASCDVDNGAAGEALTQLNATLARENELVETVTKLEAQIAELQRVKSDAVPGVGSGVESDGSHHRGVKSTEPVANQAVDGSRATQGTLSKDESSSEILDEAADKTNPEKQRSPWIMMRHAGIKYYARALPGQYSEDAARRLRELRGLLEGSTLRALRDRIASLESEAEDATTTMEKLRQEKQDQEKESSVMAKTMLEKQRQVDEALVAIEKLKAEKRNQDKESRATAEQHMLEKQDQLDEAETTIGQQMLENKTLQKEKAELARKIDSLAREITRQKDHIHDVEFDHEMLETDLKYAQDDVVRLTEDFKTSSARLEAVEESHKRYVEALEADSAKKERELRVDGDEFRRLKTELAQSIWSKKLEELHRKELEKRQVEFGRCVEKHKQARKEAEEERDAGERTIAEALKDPALNDFFGGLLIDKMYERIEQRSKDRTLSLKDMKAG